MFNVGGPEIMVVLLVALVVLGPEQLPKAMRTFGNVMAQVRKVSNGFQDEMRSAMNSIDVTSSSGSSSSTPSSPGTASSPSAPSGSSADGRSEVVARNDATSTPGPVGAPPVDPVSDRPGTSSADRAAG